MITREKKNIILYPQSKEDSLVKTNIKNIPKVNSKKETQVSESKPTKKQEEKIAKQSEKKEEKKTIQSKKNTEIPNAILNKTNLIDLQTNSLVKHTYHSFKDTSGNSGVDSALLSNCITPIKKGDNSNISIQRTDTFPVLSEFILRNKEVIFKEKFKIKNEDKTYTNSIFYPHVLKIKHPNPIYIHHKENGVGFSVLFLSLALFALVQVLYQKRFQMFKNAFLNNRYAAQIMREENVLNYRISQLLTVIFLLTGSLFIFQINKFYSAIFPEMEQWKQYLIILAGFSSFFAIKFILNKILGYIFLVEKEIKEFLFNYFLFNQFWGLGSIIILAFLEYGREFPFSQIMIFGLLSYTLVFVYQIIRSYSLAMPNKRISNLYLFLYFCTLEILPLVIISSFLF